MPVSAIPAAPRANAQGEMIVQVQATESGVIAFPPMPSAPAAPPAPPRRPATPVRPGDAGIRVIPNDPAPAAQSEDFGLAPGPFTEFQGKR
jgi:hypothetical protein